MRVALLIAVAACLMLCVPAMGGASDADARESSTVDTNNAFGLPASAKLAATNDVVAANHDGATNRRRRQQQQQSAAAKAHNSAAPVPRKMARKSGVSVSSIQNNDDAVFKVASVMDNKGATPATEVLVMPTPVAPAANPTVELEAPVVQGFSANSPAASASDKQPQQQAAPAASQSTPAAATPATAEQQSVPEMVVVNTAEPAAHVAEEVVDDTQTKKQQQPETAEEVKDIEDADVEVTPESESESESDSDTDDAPAADSSNSSSTDKDAVFSIASVPQDTVATQQPAAAPVATTDPAAVAAAASEPTAPTTTPTPTPAEPADPAPAASAAPATTTTEVPAASSTPADATSPTATTQPDAPAAAPVDQPAAAPPAQPAAAAETPLATTPEPAAAPVTPPAADVAPVAATPAATTPATPAAAVPATPAAPASDDIRTGFGLPTSNPFGAGDFVVYKRDKSGRLVPDTWDSEPGLASTLDPNWMGPFALPTATVPQTVETPAPAAPVVPATLPAPVTPAAPVAPVAPAATNSVQPSTAAVAATPAVTPAAPVTPAAVVPTQQAPVAAQPAAPVVAPLSQSTDPTASVAAVQQQQPAAVPLSQQPIQPVPVVTPQVAPAALPASQQPIQPTVPVTALPIPAPPLETPTPTPTPTPEPASTPALQPIPMLVDPEQMIAVPAPTLIQTGRRGNRGDRNTATSQAPGQIGWVDPAAAAASEQPKTDDASSAAVDMPDLVLRSSGSSAGIASSSGSSGLTLTPTRCGEALWASCEVPGVCTARQGCECNAAVGTKQRENNSRCKCPSTRGFKVSNENGVSSCMWDVNFGQTIHYEVPRVGTVELPLTLANNVCPEFPNKVVSAIDMATSKPITCPRNVEFVRLEYKRSAPWGTETCTPGAGGKYVLRTTMRGADRGACFSVRVTTTDMRSYNVIFKYY